MMVAAFPLIRTLARQFSRSPLKSRCQISYPRIVDLFRAGLVILRGEIATHDRSNTDDPEKILGHITARVSLRIVLISNVDGRSVEIPGIMPNDCCAARMSS